MPFYRSYSIPPHERLDASLIPGVLINISNFLIHPGGDFTFPPLVHVSQLSEELIFKPVFLSLKKI
jgi:hypothetical protein